MTMNTLCCKLLLVAYVLTYNSINCYYSNYSAPSYASDGCNSDYGVCKRFANASSDFIRFEDFENMVSDGSDRMIDLFISGRENAGIILSEWNSSGPYQRFYEIEIGSNGNDYTKIKLHTPMAGYEVVKEESTSAILQPGRFKRFTITLSNRYNATIIRVYADSKLIIEAHPSASIRLNYFRVTAVGETNGALFYRFDCKCPVLDIIRDPYGLNSSHVSISMRITGTASTQSVAFGSRIFYAFIFLVASALPMFK